MSLELSIKLHLIKSLLFVVFILRFHIKLRFPQREYIEVCKMKMRRSKVQAEEREKNVATAAHQLLRIS